MRKLNRGGVWKLAKTKNFGGLVLGCIEADVCFQIRIFQHYWGSTSFKYLCTFGIPFLFFLSFFFESARPAGWGLPDGSPPQRSPVKLFRRKDKGHRKNSVYVRLPIYRCKFGQNNLKIPEKSAKLRKILSSERCEATRRVGSISKNSENCVLQKSAFDEADNERSKNVFLFCLFEWQRALWKMRIW